MIVKVRTKAGDEMHFQSNDTPIMIVFERNEKDLVKGMDHDATRFLCYDDRVLTESQARKWIEVFFPGKERP